MTEVDLYILGSRTGFRQGGWWGVSEGGCLVELLMKAARKNIYTGRDTAKGYPSHRKMGLHNIWTPLASGEGVDGTPI